MDLVPGEFVFGVAAALTYGEKKYAAWNWAKGLKLGRCLGALLRHAYARLAGAIFDPESGLKHSWHMGACVAMLLGGEERGLAVDDIEPSQQAWTNVHKHYELMKDPRNTVKNGGGTLT